jgi:predicted N-formylglutamate amidohydrolase
MALLFVQVFYRPSVDNVIEVKQDEGTDEDDVTAFSESLTSTLHRSADGFQGPANSPQRAKLPP